VTTTLTWWRSELQLSWRPEATTRNYHIFRSISCTRILGLSYTDLYRYLLRTSATARQAALGGSHMVTQVKEKYEGITLSFSVKQPCSCIASLPHSHLSLQDCRMRINGNAPLFSHPQHKSHVENFQHIS
jgi:hypothetical protein